MALDALDNDLDTQSSEQRLQAVTARLSTARARATALNARRLLASQDAADSLKYAHGPTHAQIEELRAQLTAALVEVGRAAHRHAIAIGHRTSEGHDHAPREVRCRARFRIARRRLAAQPPQTA